MDRFFPEREDPCCFKGQLIQVSFPSTVLPNLPIEPIRISTRFLPISWSERRSLWHRSRRNFGFGDFQHFLVLDYLVIVILMPSTLSYRLFVDYLVFEKVIIRTPQLTKSIKRKFNKYVWRLLSFPSYGIWECGP